MSVTHPTAATANVREVAYLPRYDPAADVLSRHDCLGAMVAPRAHHVPHLMRLTHLSAAVGLQPSLPAFRAGVTRLCHAQNS